MIEALGEKSSNIISEQINKKEEGQAAHIKVDGDKVIITIEGGTVPTKEDPNIAVNIPDKKIIFSKREMKDFIAQLY